MTSWQINDLFANWQQTADLPAIEISGLTLDSRQVQDGDLFVAVQGANGHGLDYADAAVANGCAVIAYDPDQARQWSTNGLAVPVIAIPGIANQLGDVCSCFHGETPVSRSGGKYATDWISYFPAALSLAAAPFAARRSGTRRPGWPPPSPGPWAVRRLPESNRRWRLPAMTVPSG